MKNNRKNILVIGGTGIVGYPMIMSLIRHNEYTVYSVALDKKIFPPAVKQFVADRTSAEFPEVIERLSLEAEYFFDAVIDIVSFDDTSSQVLYSLIKNYTQHFITLSTTLVYDRSEEHHISISESVPLVARGTFGGYVDGKIRLEQFWNTVTDVNWTLIRPYHILGKGSLLGCVPEHNRDPELVKKLERGETLKLCNGGVVWLNCVHPDDIATAVYKIIGNTKTFRQAYNVVNPVAITAKEYYQEIANQLNTQCVIESVSMDTVWNDFRRWELTTLPHLYDVSKLKNDTGFVPIIPLKQCISDAIKYPAKIVNPETAPVHSRMNKPPNPGRPKWLN